ncbi:CvpA family protein [Gluconobacter morbifer]|uniref:Colicin V production protein n=1 Tax=Gluconobacter morbifer G707 TaxID=1088869 RepID=G6XFR9_9PROT|nr:CvpA family protein [Gluconobacter morbifer]EHH69027.1 hypothetical protein GMO_03340 [Gluconobacter morbifer G707]
MPAPFDLSHFSFDALTRLDVAALAIMGLSALWGLTRGFATELSGLLAWVGAIVVTYRFHALLVPYLAPYIHEDWLLGSASTAILFIVVLLFFTMVASRIGTAARGVLFGGVDRLLGAAFGLARGYVGLIALYLICGSFFGSGMSYVMHGSLIGPYIALGAARLTGYLPHFLQPHLAPPPSGGHEATL